MPHYTCPYCFTKVNPSDIWYQCASTSCTEQNEVWTRYRNNIEPTQPLPSGTVIIPHQTIFKGKSRERGICPKPECCRHTSVRVCASCHNAFPSGIDGLSNDIIAIVGARGTGKSHYIAVLVQKLRQLGSKFHWTFSALNDETMKTYDEHFYRPLYLQRMTLKQTQTATFKGNEHVKAPMIYSLDIYGTKKTVILAFFDAAGEDLTSEDTMKQVNKYIANASGIILLLDPTLIPDVNSEIQKNYSLAKKADDDDIIHHKNMLNRLSNFLRTQGGYDLTQSHTVHLAVTFSKIDFLRGVINEEEFELFARDITHDKNNLNLDALESISDFIKPWLKSKGASDFVSDAQKFASHQFFGMSALGTDPNSHQNKIPGGPKPMHVEDPFLWLLYANGLMPGK